MRRHLQLSAADASRLPLGISVGFEPRQFYSGIRLNYSFPADDPGDGFSDKVYSFNCFEQ